MEKRQALAKAFTVGEEAFGRLEDDFVGQVQKIRGVGRAHVP